MLWLGTGYFKVWIVVLVLEFVFEFKVILIDVFVENCFIVMDYMYLD